MRKLLYITFLVTLSLSKGFAQNEDSLWNVFNDTSQADTIRLKAIDRIGFSLQRVNPDSAIEIAKIQLQYAIKTNQKNIKGGLIITLEILISIKIIIPKH